MEFQIFTSSAGPDHIHLVQLAPNSFRFICPVHGELIGCDVVVWANSLLDSSSK